MLNYSEARTHLIQEPPQVEFDGEAPFKSAFRIRVPESPGVYMISDLRGPLYIGRTYDLYVRYDNHLTYSHNENLRRALDNHLGIVYFRWIESEASETARLEKELISRMLPLCNDHKYRGLGEYLVT